VKTARSAPMTALKTVATCGPEPNMRYIAAMRPL
jgi:hypothetical protein